MEKRKQGIERIVETFLRERGSGLFLSPLDSTLLLTWVDEGVPEGVILSGIEKGVERWKSKKGGGALSLWRLKGAIVKDIREYVKRGICMRGGESGERSPLLLRLLRIRERVGSLPSSRENSWPAPLYREFLKGLESILATLRSGRGGREGDALERLYRLREEFLDGLRSGLPHDLKEELRKEVEPILEKRGALLSPRERRQLLDALLRRALFSRFPLFDHKDLMGSDL